MNISGFQSLTRVFLFFGFIIIFTMGNVNEYDKYCQLSESNSEVNITCINGSLATLISEISANYDSKKINLTFKLSHFNRISRRIFRSINFRTTNITFINNTIQILHIDVDVMKCKFQNNKLNLVKRASPGDCPYNRSIKNQLIQEYYIDLSNNEIIEIENFVYDCISHLFYTKYHKYEINMEYCSLQKFPELVFHQMFSFKTIKLSHNNFLHIPKNSFNNTRVPSSLAETSISLDHCQIEKIDNNAFCHVVVELVNISNNNIETLNSNMFHNCLIRYLDLSHNRIKVLNPQVLSSLDNFLWKLYVQNNAIETIEKDTFIRNTKLEYLNLLNNPIKSIEASDFFKLTPFEHTKFILPEVKFEKIEKCTFCELTSIKNLYLTNRGIQQIVPGAFEGLTSLINLHLNHNNITTLDPGVFDGLDNIIYIDLSHNIISNLSFISFRGVQTTRHLHINLNNNKIVTIPDGFFSNTPKLFELKLKHNRIENLQKNVFKDLKSLSVLNLARNHLKEIDIDIFKNTALSSLDISSNYLTELDVEKLLQTNRIFELNIYDNKWECLYLYNMINTLYYKEVDYTSMLNEDEAYALNNIICSENGNYLEEKEEGEDDAEAKEDDDKQHLNNWESIVVWSICICVGLIFLICIILLIYSRRRYRTKLTSRFVAIMSKSSNVDNLQVEIISNEF